MACSSVMDVGDQERGRHASAAKHGVHAKNCHLLKVIPYRLPKNKHLLCLVEYG